MGVITDLRGRESKVKIQPSKTEILGLGLLCCFSVALIPAPASAAPCNNSIASGRSAVSPDGAIFATVRGADAKERLYLYDLEKHSHRVVDFADAGVGEVEAICWMNDSELVASHRARIPVRGLGERSDQGVAILKYSYLTREGKITTTVTAPPNADNGQYQLLRRQ